MKDQEMVDDGRVTGVEYPVFGGGMASDGEYFTTLQPPSLKLQHVTVLRLLFCSCHQCYGMNEASGASTVATLTP